MCVLLLCVCVFYSFAMLRTDLTEFLYVTWTLRQNSTPLINAAHKMHASGTGVDWQRSLRLIEISFASASKQRILHFNLTVRLLCSYGFNSSE